MTATLPPRDTPPRDTPASPGNAIVPTPGSVAIDFPTLILGAVVVGTSIYLVSEQSHTAGWLLTILLLLSIGYAQRNFGNEIANLVSGH